jgi:endonuclease YncB( thermonuclease family)
MTLARTIFLITSIWSFATTAQIQGKVVSIADGDTFTMLVDNEQVKVRLHGIDCPEKGQDFGNVAKEFLADYVFGKVVSVKYMDTDRYGRTIGMVVVGGVNLNEKLLEAGLAWHYKTYDKNPDWAKLEEQARRAKKGLWVQPNAVPPWDYRKMKNK